jgi:hypothetical protein
MDVDESEDYLMAWHDTTFIINNLSAWSNKFAIDWQVYSAGDHIGDIRSGMPCQGVTDFLSGLLEASGLQPSQVAEIDQKFANRCEQPLEQPGSNEVLVVTNAAKPWWRFW